MAEITGDRITNRIKKNWSRRKLLVNVIGIAASPALIEEAEARSVRHHHFLYSKSAQMHNFAKVVNAFNDLHSTLAQWQSPNYQSVPLYQLLDPQVKAFKLSSGHEIDGVYDVVNFFYGLVANINGQWAPQFIPTYQGATPDFNTANHVKSHGSERALWIDNDGSQDLLHYDFLFNPSTNQLNSLHSA